MLTESQKIRVREIIDEAIAAGVTAGASLLAVQDGEEILFEARGYANLERKLPLRRDHIFRLFSMSKPITAAAAMILMEQGKLDLATPVKELIPGYGDDYILQTIEGT